MIAIQGDDQSVTYDVMAGIILLNDKRCRVLLDISASHSFISRTFALTSEICKVETTHIKWVQVLEHTFYVIDYYIS